MSSSSTEPTTTVTEVREAAAEQLATPSSSTSASTAAPSSASAASSLPHRRAQSEAHDRAVRFGLVFSQLGAANKEAVFPHGIRHMPRLLTLDEITGGKMRRQSLEELEAKIRSARRWWSPLSWFGPPTAEEIEWKRREAQRKADDADRKRRLAEATDKATQAEEERRIDALNRLAAGEAAAKAAEAEEAAAAEAAAAEAAAEAAKPKRYPLKVDIDPRALTPEEEASLTTTVANHRAGILESEKQIHQMMDAVEKTRMQYLRAAPGPIKCEREIVAVLSCYEEAKVKSGGNRAAALKCGPSVDLLEACSLEVARAHMRQ